MPIEALQQHPRARLALLPTPVHRLERLTQRLGGPELWIKRDDLTGLAGGGNKTRKLEFLVGDALRCGADTLVTVGAIQSNHTRQRAAAAARAGLGCVLLHNGWAPDAGPFYRRTGNVLLSEILGAELGVDFDVIVHCTGSSGTQAGLLAGLAALSHPARVIGVSDDEETAEK